MDIRSLGSFTKKNSRDKDLAQTCVDAFEIENEGRSICNDSSAQKLQCLMSTSLSPIVYRIDETHHVIISKLD